MSSGISSFLLSPFCLPIVAVLSRGPLGVVPTVLLALALVGS